MYAPNDVDVYSLSNYVLVMYRYVYVHTHMHQTMYNVDVYTHTN